MEISSNGTYIEFKSEPFFYTKEKCGTKPNTVRIVKDDELKELNTFQFQLKKILIKNVDTDEYFVRELTDVSQLPGYEGEGEIFIFSWKSYKLIDD